MKNVPLPYRSQVADREELFPLAEGELVQLLQFLADNASNGATVDLAWGIHGSALRWSKGEPMPLSVYRLMELRGMTTENLSGDGI